MIQNNSDQISRHEQGWSSTTQVHTMWLKGFKKLSNLLSVRSILKRESHEQPWIARLISSFWEHYDHDAKI
ncbi:hypothetical protein ACHQM5_025470 [Ranunculus cassubicifolius]